MTTARHASWISALPPAIRRRQRGQRPGHRDAGLHGTGVHPAPRGQRTFRRLFGRGHPVRNAARPAGLRRRQPECGHAAHRQAGYRGCPRMQASTSDCAPSCYKATARDPALRFQTASQFAEALDNYLDPGVGLDWRQRQPAVDRRFPAPSHAPQERFPGPVRIGQRHQQDRQRRDERASTSSPTPSSRTSR